MFTSVELARRNGSPVFVQPCHVASLEPVTFGDEQGCQTQITLASGVSFTVVDPPSTVRRKLQAGA